MKELEDFAERRIIDGCLPCIDGMLFLIQTSSPNETGNVTAYYSGHLAEFGINIKAACDSNCHCVSCCTQATWDVVAYWKIKLSKLVDHLPLGTLGTMHT